jgi:hypothetical protein
MRVEWLQRKRNGLPDLVGGGLQKLIVHLGLVSHAQCFAREVAA